jgi:hypothetical protein
MKNLPSSIRYAIWFAGIYLILIIISFLVYSLYVVSFLDLLIDWEVFSMLAIYFISIISLLGSVVASYWITGGSIYSDVETLKIGVIFSLLLYFVIGGLIGWIVGKVKSRKQTNLVS